jgi:hypothetical protein
MYILSNSLVFISHSRDTNFYQTGAMSESFSALVYEYATNLPNLQVWGMITSNVWWWIGLV